METAEKQVLDVVKVDIHLDYTPDGKRYIDRISEIVQLEEGVPYPEYHPEDPNSINELTAEYYRRQTDRVGFATRLIMKYDLKTHTYVAVDHFSEFLENKIKANLGNELSVNFDEFMLREWGPRPGTAEAELPEGEIQKKLEEYTEKIQEITASYEDIKNNSDATSSLEASNNISISASDIEMQAKEKAAWASGYVPDDNSQAGAFELGDFFSDDDYT